MKEQHADVYHINIPQEMLEGEFSLTNLFKEYSKDPKILTKLENNRDKFYYFIFDLNQKMIKSNKFEYSLSFEKIRYYFNKDHKICEKFVKEKLLILKYKYIVGQRANVYKVFDRFNHLKETIAIWYTNEQYKQLTKKTNSNSYLSRHILKCMNELILPDLNLDEIKEKVNSLSFMHISNYYNDFREKNWFIKETRYNRGGRLFCTVNMMNNEYLRKNLSHNSKKNMIEIDCCNSQPWFLAQLLKSEYIIDEYGEYYNFVKYCENGTIYEELAKNYKNKNKSDIKTMLYSTIFKIYDQTEDDKLIISKLFSNYTEVLVMINSLRKKYGNLAVKLQQIESNFFIQILSKKMYKDSKFVIPVHDSVMCLDDDKQYVMNIINEYFLLEYGVVPVFKIK